MMSRIILAGLIFWGLALTSTAGTLYQWVDESGQTRYGYRPPAGTQAITAEESDRKLHESGTYPS
ncbi:MAG: DUF4124 domain-containing protein, partial [Methylococcaceae bacterium]|nr:DUF4124 domain-containing protein [Methylococcaceae bacterium]